MSYSIFNYLIYFMVFLQMLGLTFAVLMDPYISKRNQRVILLNSFLTFVLVVQNYLDYSFSNIEGAYRYRTFDSIIGYSVRPVILVMWMYLVTKDKKMRLSWILIIINLLIHLSALFTNVCFTITPANDFRRGPLGYTCHIVSGALLLYLIWMSTDTYIDSAYNKVNKKNEFQQAVVNYKHGIEGLIPIWCMIIIVISVILDSKIYLPYATISFLTVAIVSCNLFYYIWIHLGFVREHEEELRAHQRIQIMVSQIRPQFLYNTLSSIQRFCSTEPGKAAETAEKLEVYLRQNFEALNESGLVPFSKELEHTKAYVAIEQMRYPSIEVDYDVKGLEEGDFDIPPLTVQPIVGNAILHGVRSIDDGVIHIIVRKVDGDSEDGMHNGEIYKKYAYGVESYRQNRHYEIVIEDNGKGFNTEQLAAQGDEHIGLATVRERIETLCGGSVSIQSEPDAGTTVTIKIPY